MKCSKHPETDATAFCIHCGQALCPQCVTKSKSSRVVCSAACGLALDRMERVITGIAKRHISGSRSVGLFSAGTGLVFLVFSFVKLYEGFLQMFAYFAVTGVALLLVGVRSARLANKQEIEDAGG